MLNRITWNRTVLTCKLALNNLQELICYKAKINKFKTHSSENKMFAFNQFQRLQSIYLWTKKSEEKIFCFLKKNNFYLSIYSNVFMRLYVFLLIIIRFMIGRTREPSVTGETAHGYKYKRMKCLTSFHWKTWDTFDINLYIHFITIEFCVCVCVCRERKNRNVCFIVFP